MLTNYSILLAIAAATQGLGLVVVWRMSRRWRRIARRLKTLEATTDNATIWIDA
jgi:hypothetical protein